MKSIGDKSASRNCILSYTFSAIKVLLEVTNIRAVNHIEKDSQRMEDTRPTNMIPSALQQNIDNLIDFL